MFKAYSFIKRNRIRKKWKEIKQLILLTIDFTTLFYGIIVLGYFLFALYSEGFTQIKFLQRLKEFERYIQDYVWYIVTIVPIARLMRAFQTPGVLISSAEYQLMLLPYSRMKIWLMAACERWLKDICIYLAIGIIVYLFTPLSPFTIALYAFFMMILNIVLTAIEWKFFQASIYVKVFTIIGLMLVNTFQFIIQSPVFAMTFLILLIIWNVFLWNKLFDEIDWQKVTAANDYKLWQWRMHIISYATKIKFKKDRKYNIWQKLPFWKRPFPYEKESLYHRLWHLYLEKNIGYILQLVGVLLLMLFVFSFMKEWLFLLAIVVVIHIYTTFAVALFRHRLTTDIVQVIPWDMNVFIRTFEQWILSSGIILFIPIFLHAYRNFTLWTVMLWALIIIAFYILLHFKLYQVYVEMDQKNEKLDIFYIVSYGLLVMIFLSYQFQVALLVGCAVGLFGMYYLKEKTTPRLN